jgi:hypothetical protein
MRTLLCSTLLMLACGGSSTTTSSCDLRNAAQYQYCQQYDGSSAFVSAYKSQCPSSGTWADAACTHASALGGCRSLSGSDSVTTWFYSGGQYASAADVMAGCTSPSTFVAP